MSFITVELSVLVGIIKNFKKYVKQKNRQSRTMEKVQRNKKDVKAHWNIKRTQKD